MNINQSIERAYELYRFELVKLKAMNNDCNRDFSPSGERAFNLQKAVVDLAYNEVIVLQLLNYDGV